MTRPDLGYSHQERERAARWKRTSPSLPVEARADSHYGLRGDGTPGPAYGFCLPRDQATYTLLPEVRATALQLFEELGIPWHKGIGGGPSNHLLSSQVQCVNALGQMVADPSRIQLAFGELLGTSEVLQIEAGRYLTFEYIGPTDYFGESPSGKRVRGSQCTSVDAAFLHRTVSGATELVLVEWKYTESYRLRTPDPAKDEVRRHRYERFLTRPDSPVRADLLGFVDLLDEPFYQLMRQQLLAHELERAHVLGADVVRVVHVHPAANLAYQQSLHRPSQLALGANVTEVWDKLLRRPDRYQSVDNSLFLDPAITSAEYIARYGGT